MAEFKKLSAVEAVASVSDTASVLIEEDGVIKRAPKSEIGGGVNDMVVSWNDLTDKPFYEVAGKTIFDETVDFNGEQYYSFANGLPLTNGNPYTVILDGVEYNMTANYDSPDTYLTPIPEINGKSFYIYDYGLNYPDSGVHTLKIIDQSSAEIKQIDRKFIPQLPILIKVYTEETIPDTYSVKCRCDLTEWEIEQLMGQGPLLYAVLYDNVQDNWIMNKDAGFFYCDRYSYPDDDRVIFTSPNGERSIVFSSLGTVTYFWN